MPSSAGRAGFWPVGRGGVPSGAGRAWFWLVGPEGMPSSAGLAGFDRYAHDFPGPAGRGQRRDVPVLLSVGYSSCHWCQ
ncbi:DUF255 domain-containing protein [Streptomyces sp. A0958]|nr:DUF255 domain-containing protein [Streptomyces sp. A0958]